MDIHARAKAAEIVARKAGEMLLNTDKFEVRIKGANDFVTEMDVRSETMIREALLGEFPEDGFYGEESGATAATAGRWVVDPIDGTQSFMRGHHGYTISIAYEYKGELVFGCVYYPDCDEMFTAIRGEGAFMNGKPIHVSDISNPREAIIHFGYGHRVAEDREIMMKIFPHLLANISDVRRYGSAAYALCCVACGRSEAFFERSLNLYDIAGGMVVLEEAGGKSSGWPNEGHCLETGNVVFTNGHIHGFMMQQLNV